MPILQLRRVARAESIIPKIKRLSQVPLLNHGPFSIRQYMDEALLDNLSLEVVLTEVVLKESQNLPYWGGVLRELNYRLHGLGRLAPLSVQLYRYFERIKRRFGFF
jgi:hypothetical protein